MEISKKRVIKHEIKVRELLRKHKIDPKLYRILEFDADKYANLT